MDALTCAAFAASYEAATLEFLNAYENLRHWEGTVSTLKASGATSELTLAEGMADFEYARLYAANDDIKQLEANAPVEWLDGVTP